MGMIDKKLFDNKRKRDAMALIVVSVSSNAFSVPHMQASFYLLNVNVSVFSGEILYFVKVGQMILFAKLMILQIVQGLMADCPWKKE